MIDQLPSETNRWANRLHRRTRHLAAWTAAWMVTMAAAAFGPTFLWDARPALTIGAIALNVLAGAGMIVANLRHLRSQDELMQRVQLEAMGFALGVGVVGGLAYSLLDTTNVIASDAEIANVVMLMGLVYLVAVVAGMRRYR